jgi:glycosyltransferase involved in cell wall biosynthesis
MSRLKVLQVATSIVGGAGIAARRLNEALNTDPDLNSILIYKNGPVSQNANAEIKIDSDFHLKIQSMSRTYLQQEFVQNSSKLVSPFNVDHFPINHHAYTASDIVHFHAFYNFLDYTSLERAKSDGKKIVVTLHDERFFTGGCHYTVDCVQFETECSNCPQVRRIFHRSIHDSQLKAIEVMHSLSGVVFISPSYWLAQRARRSSVIAAARIEVVSNPIPDFAQTLEPKKVRDELGISKDTITLGFISSDLENPYKGFEILTLALGVLATSSKKKYVLILVGQSKEITGLSIPVFLKQARDEVELAGLLSAIDILVVPSKQDNSPNVIGEALRAGTPVLGSDSGGVPELLKIAGLPIFESGNWKDLAEKIDSYNFDVDSKSLRKFAEDTVGYKVISNRMKEIYQSI